MPEHNFTFALATYAVTMSPRRIISLSIVSLALVAGCSQADTAEQSQVTREARGGWAGPVATNLQLGDTSALGINDEDARRALQESVDAWNAQHPTVPPPPVVNGCTLQPHTWCQDIEFFPGLNFPGIDLQGARFYASDLRNSNLSGANLQGVGFAGANLADSNLRNANLKWSGLQAVLSDVDLSGAQIIESDLTKARLDDANFSGANLSGSNFTMARMWGTNLSAANIQGACFAGTDFFNTTMPDGSLRSSYDAEQWLNNNGANSNC